MKEKLAVGVVVGLLIGAAIWFETRNPPAEEEEPVTKGEPESPKPLKRAEKPKSKPKPAPKEEEDYSDWLKPFMESQKRKVEAMRHQREAHKEARKQSLRDNTVWAHRMNCGLNGINRSI